MERQTDREIDIHIYESHLRHDAILDPTIQHKSRANGRWLCSFPVCWHSRALRWFLQLVCPDSPPMMSHEILQYLKKKDFAEVKNSNSILRLHMPPTIAGCVSAIARICEHWEEETSFLSNIYIYIYINIRKPSLHSYLWCTSRSGLHHPETPSKPCWLQTKSGENSI